MLVRRLLNSHKVKKWQGSRPGNGDSLSYAADHFPRINDLQEFLKQAKRRFDLDWKSKPIPHGDISEYQKYQIISQGRFNTVILAKHRNSSKKCALKCFDKCTLVHSNLVDKVHYEMKVLLTMQFPFVMSLDCVMQDKTSLYLSMPFIECGDLYTHIKKLGGLEELHARFYAAQLCLGLEYLHCLSIVHRDLKPENILLDYMGYLKITDMGFCKIVDSRTYSFCGTPEYIAPEIINTHPYGTSVDWWAFGVLLYEMCYGQVPFKHNNVHKLYTLILSGKYNTSTLMSEDLKDLISKLLEIDVTKRYGCLRNGAADIKEHPWFKTVDWLTFVNREALTPYAPYCLGPPLMKGIKFPTPTEHICSSANYDHLFEKF